MTAMPQQDRLTADKNAAAAPRPSRRWLVMGSVPLLVAGAGVWLWLDGQGKVSTDNAYVRQDKVAISSDVTGRIAEVMVAENQRVRRGQVLARLATDPFEMALAEADARLASARLQVRQLKTGTAGSAADLRARREALALATTELERQQQLMKDGFTTRARLQQAEYFAANARAELERGLADDAQVRAAANDAASIENHPLVMAARAARDRAAFDLSRTTIKSPANGIATQTTRVLRGQVMVQGVAAMSVMVDGSRFVEANFKETDLEHMRVGQRAEVRLDAFPGQVVAGKVDSIGVGTGAEFAVLPPQNATGNWVKVVQRVPVRIAITQQKNVPLIAGLSADVTVFTK
jgi:membrane fusion protein (multidrug efflux system)